MNIPAGSDIEFQSATLYNKKLPGAVQRFQTGHLIEGRVRIESPDRMHVYCSIGHYPSSLKRVVSVMEPLYPSASLHKFSLSSLIRLPDSLSTGGIDSKIVSATAVWFSLLLFPLQPGRN